MNQTSVKQLCSFVAALVLAVSWAGHAQAGPLRVFAWGDNSSNQTIPPATVTNISAIAAGYFHALVLRSNGTVVVWGDNSNGQTNPQPSLTNIVAIEGGGRHSLALRSNTTVFGWGLNNFGQANPPAGLTNVTRISAGANHSMALRANGTVVAWGSNSSGQTNVPPGLTNVVAISAGENHCLALRANGTMIAWGENFSGQTNIPVDATNIMAIGAGYHHNLAVRSNGTVIAWGVNVFEELTIPPGLSNVIAVASGQFLSAALKSDGTVVAWGQNFSGATNVPIGLRKVSSLAVGWDFCMALSSSGLCPPGFADNCECSPVLTGNSVTNNISNVSATREPGEPLHAGLSTTNSLWYAWTAPGPGGVVVQAIDGSSFASPVLAVYTGSEVNSLTNVAFNFPPFSGLGTPAFRARVAFTAVQGQTYLIAVDGLPTDNYENRGSLTLTLNFSPPPTNDLFSNAITIAGIYYDITNGTFLGASREANEPTHGTSFPQTLWWNWTAPTNLNVSAIPMRLTADAVSFPPVFGIYTGSSIAALSSVTFTQSFDGMTRAATFSAVPGSTYRIALAGAQNDTNSVLPLVGNYRFRLNTRALALSIVNLVTNTTPTQALSFTATARVEHLGSAASGPLRIRTVVVPGISMRGDTVGTIPETNVVQNTWSLLPLSPGQSSNQPISGIAPAPVGADPGSPSARGFGVYAELQEQFGLTNWAAVEQALVLYGPWPNLEGLPGPGGGVIRLDPGYVGTSAFNPLASVTVFGPTNVMEGSLASYSGQARYANNFLFNFTNTVWVVSRFSITTNGAFTPGIVTSNSPVTLTAKFSNSGFLYDAPTNLTVINLPPPKLAQAKVTGGSFIMQVQGVSNRIHVIEATTNLAPPAVWQPVSTNNLGPSGVLNFTNPTVSHPRRFFRAREAE